MLAREVSESVQMAAYGDDVFCSLDTDVKINTNQPEKQLKIKKFRAAPLLSTAIQHLKNFCSW